MRSQSNSLGIRLGFSNVWKLSTASVDYRTNLSFFSILKCYLHDVIQSLVLIGRVKKFKIEKRVANSTHLQLSRVKNRKVILISRGSVFKLESCFIRECGGNLNIFIHTLFFGASVRRSLSWQQIWRTNMLRCIFRSRKKWILFVTGFETFLMERFNNVFTINLTWRQSSSTFLKKFINYGDFLNRKDLTSNIRFLNRKPAYSTNLINMLDSAIYWRSARLVSMVVAQLIEGGFTIRVIVNGFSRFLTRLVNTGLGVKVVYLVISGKMGRKGRTSSVGINFRNYRFLQTLNTEVKYGVSEAFTKTGVYSIKVWLI